MLTEEIINDRFTRLEKLIRESRPKEKRTWVSVSVVKDVTIWKDHKDLQKAREQGLIKFKDQEIVKEDGKIVTQKLYLLESISDVFIKK